MKKVLYLSLTGLMVLSSTTRCMEQIIKADEEAQETAPGLAHEADKEIKVYGPQLPTKEETITTFLEAAALVALKGRYSVASSEQFKTMRDSYGVLNAINKGDKNKTRTELFGGYCSDDEEYYTRGLDDEEKTAKRVKFIDSIVTTKIQPKVIDNQKKSEQLKQEKESIDKALEALYVKRAANAKARTKNVQENELLAKVTTMHSNSKEQESSLLHSRAEALIEEINAIDERIATYKNEALVVLDANVSKSMIAEVVKEQVDTEAGLLIEKAKLQEKLDKINAIMAKLNQEPSSGWFSFGW